MPWQPVWDKINDFEIEAKQRRLLSLLRGRDDKKIDRAAAEYVPNVRERRLSTFAGYKLSADAIAQKGRLRAEVRCLEDYLTGIEHIYSQYFERFDLSPSYEVLVGIWWRRILPYWMRHVEKCKGRIQDKCGNASGDLGDEYQVEAEQILKEFSLTWRVKLEEARSKEKIGSGPRISPFPTPEGATWPDVLIRFTSDRQIQISVRDRTEVRTYAECGFEDRRGKRASKPDGNWDLLLKLGRHGGTIESTESAKEWPLVEKRIQTINFRMRNLFGFSENPIPYEKKLKGYRAKFSIRPPIDDSAEE